MVELEKFAMEENVPIMQKDGIEFLKKYIRENNVKTVLEIGSAIGYSALQMASVDKKIKITTIERNERMYSIAQKNIKKYNKENQIEIIYGDALETEIKGKFDLIFIDAAKAQYINFFEKYKKNLNEGGAIISDNLSFHGLADNIDDSLSKNLKALLRKLNKYKEFLRKNSEFNTDFYDVGDGISVSRINKKS